MATKEAVTIEKYVNHHYLFDLALFLGFEPRKSGSSGHLCGMTISESLQEYRFRKFNDISAFYCCSYALNLLDYGIRKHFIVDRRTWLASVPPFADSTACSSYHGGVSNHSSMLEYLRRTAAEKDRILRIDDSELCRYLIFFLRHIDTVFPEEAEYRLPSQRLCNALNADSNQQGFTIVWNDNDVDSESAPLCLDPWQDFPKGVTKEAQKAAEPPSPVVPEDENQNRIPCPKCGKTAITTFRSSDNIVCLSCLTSMFLAICQSCGAENRGVYECRLCGGALESVSNITQETVLIDEAEADPIQKALAELRESISREPDDAAIEQAVSSGRRQMQSYPAGMFDPNRFFEVLDKVHLKEGYFLDYFYVEPDADTFGSSPDVFARCAGTLPLTCYRENSPVATVDVAAVLEYEHSPAGLFQLALFDAVHDNFYRFWHANYGDYRPILTQKQYSAILEKESGNLKPLALELLRRQDIRPRVVMTGPDSGHVTMLYFNRYKGFFWIRSVIKAGKVCQNEKEQIAWLLRTIKF